MKKHTIHLIWILSLLILSSCEEYQDSFPPYHYDTRLKVVDEAGNDVLKNINVPLLETTLKVVEIKGEKKISSADLYSNSFSTDPFLIIGGASRPDKHDRTKKIAYTLTSKELFGDKEPHTILTHWRWENLSNICDSVFVDDEKLERIVLENTSYETPYFIFKIKGSID